MDTPIPGTTWTDPVSREPPDGRTVAWGAQCGRLSLGLELDYLHHQLTLACLALCLSLTGAPRVMSEAPLYHSDFGFPPEVRDLHQ